MNRILLLMMLVLGTASVGQLQAQTFFEDFQTGIPGTWTLYNEDGLTPDPGVGFVTDAWVADTATNGNIYAASTSWYAPAGTSDDWLVTPAITLTVNEVLSWEAIAPDQDFPDGYEVRISTTGNAVADFLANPALFTIAAEAGTFTSHSVNLEALGYTNQTVYIAFRNNSTDKYLLFVDNVEVSDVIEADGRLNGNFITPYSAIPERHAEDFTFIANYENIGTDTLRGATIMVEVYNDATAAVEFTQTSAAFEVLPGNSGTQTFTTTWIPSDTGLYYLAYLLNSSNDVNAANDTLFDFIYISDTTYARDINYVAGVETMSSIGIGAGSSTAGSYLGQSFEVDMPSVLTSVTAEFVRPTANDTASVSIYSIDNGVPGALVATSDLYIFPDTNYQVVDFAFPNLVLPVDTYAVVVREYSANVSLGTTTQKFSTGTTWINWPTIPTGTWTNAEVFGANFARTFLLRANFGPCPVTIDTAYVQQPTCPDDFDGYVIVEATPTVGPLSFSWNTGETDSILLSLDADIYTITIEDAAGCQAVAAYDLTLVDPIVLSLTATDASLETSTDGSATVTATGGTAPYTYEWSRGTSTTGTVTDLAPGQIRVTVTDANGCDKVATDTIGFGVGIFTLNNDLSANIYPNPATNQVFVEVTLENSGDVQIVVMNNLGQVVIRHTEVATQVVKTALNISALPSGIYLVQITSGDASTVQKLIVE